MKRRESGGSNRSDSFLTDKWISTMKKTLLLCFGVAIGIMLSGCDESNELELSDGPEIMSGRVDIGLYRILTLNNSLNGFVLETETENLVRVESIAAKVSDGGNKPDEVMYLQYAERVRAISSDLMRWIDLDCKARLIERTGGFKADGVTPLGLSNVDAPTKLFLGGKSARGARLGIDLRDKLNVYIDVLNEIYENVSKIGGFQGELEHYDYLTLDGKDDARFRHSDILKEKGFLELAFDRESTIAALAVLTEKQSKVVEYEREILSLIQQQLGASNLKFDIVEAKVVAVASSVVAGSWYEADLSLGFRSSDTRNEHKM